MKMSDANNDEPINAAAEQDSSSDAERKSDKQKSNQFSCVN